MLRFLICSCLLGAILLPHSLTSSLMAQDKPAYRLFSGTGKKLSFKKMMRQMETAELVFFGEQHNDPIAHWLQLELLYALIEARGADAMVVGAEMFETDQQTALNQFLAQEITAEALADTIKLWPNYDTDYRPVVEACQTAGIPVIATNIPRQYARLVSQKGPLALDSLPPEEQALVCPLPLTVDESIPSYAAMREMLAGHGHGSGMNPSFFIAAQASKDATMADRLLQNWAPGRCFLHLNGAYHSDQREGIIWHILQQAPERNIFSISVVRQDTLDTLDEEHLGRADVIICVPSRMTQTY